MTVEPGWAVKLKVDLTRYHAALKIGAEGVVSLPAGRSAFFRDAYVDCLFTVPDGQKKVEVRIRDLEVTDKRWVEMQEAEKRDREAALRDHVKQATMYLGPRGGFKELVIEFSNERVNEIVKRHKEARPLIEDLRARGLLQEEGK